MKKLRDQIVLLVVAVVFGITLTLFHSAVGVTSPWFSLVVMLDFLGLVAFARPLFLLKMPPFLRQLRAWEVRGRIYKALGVPAFGALLRRTPLHYLNLQVYLSRNPDDAAHVHAQIEAAEAAHVWAAALIVPYMIYACVQNRWSVVAWFMVVQFVANVYPIMHLRWVRARLQRLLDRKLAYRKPNPTEPRGLSQPTAGA
jgi:hypothetical protein